MRSTHRPSASRAGVANVIPNRSPVRVEHLPQDAAAKDKENAREAGTVRHAHPSARTPRFFADGRHFVFFVQGENPGLYLGQLDGPPPHRLIDADAGIYAAGQLLFVRQRRLYSQDFDPVRLEAVGSANILDEPIFTDGGIAPLSASETGAVLYRTGPVVGRRQLVWVDRTGTPVGRLGGPDNASPLTPEMSPDGRYVALSRTVNGNQDVWLLESRGVLTRLTSDPASDALPVWSPDSRSIVFNSSRNGVFDLYRRRIDGSGGEDRILATAIAKGPSDWSPDGRVLLYRSPDVQTGLDLWAFPMDGSRPPFPVVRTNFDERDGQFSPDGKWIAYQSNESGQFEIYVQRFDGTGERTRVSRNGGAQVRWRRDGRECSTLVWMRT